MTKLGTRAKDRELDMLLRFYKSPNPIWLKDIRDQYALRDLLDYGYIKDINTEQYVITEQGKEHVQTLLNAMMKFVHKFISPTKEPHETI